METCEKIFKRSGTDKDYFNSYGDYIDGLLKGLDGKALSEVAKVFLKARQEDKTIFFAGNGGSASTASHFSQDLGEVGRKSSSKWFKTLSLNDNMSFFSAVANDYGYDKVFTIPIKQLFSSGDVLVVISASGNSPNVVAAVEEAKKLGGTTIALVGFDGGKLGKISDHVILVKSEKGEYGPVEDVHMVLDHMITSYLINLLKEEKEKK